MQIQINLNEEQQSIKEQHLNQLLDMKNQANGKMEYKPFQNYKEVISRSKIDQDDKIILLMKNPQMLKKDPGTDRLQYYYSLVGEQLIDYYRQSYKIHFKHKDNIEKRLFEFNQANSDLKRLQQDNKQKDTKLLSKYKQVIQCLLRDNDELRYHIVWSICVYNFYQMFKNEESCYIFTNFVIHQIYPAGYFKYQYKFGIKNSYDRFIAKQYQSYNPGFADKFIFSYYKKKQIVKNDEAYLDLIEKVNNRLLNKFYYYPGQKLQQFTRIVDYLFVFRMDLLLKMGYMVIDDLSRNLHQQVKNILDEMKNPNIQDIIFANKQVEIAWSSVNLLKIAEEVVYRSKGNKVLLNYELNMNELLEEAFDDEFRITYYYGNRRINQIRRVIAILMMRGYEISKDRMNYFRDVFKKTQWQMLDFKMLVQLFDAYNEYSGVKVDFIQTVMSLSQQEGTMLTKQELCFILTLVSKQNMNEKMVALLMLFLSQQKYNRHELEYYLCSMEQMLDSNLGLMNRGSTLMDLVKNDSLDRVELINMFMKKDQCKYLMDYLKAIQSNQMIDDGNIMIHYQSHDEYINQLVYKKQMEKMEQEKERQRLIEERRKDQQKKDQQKDYYDSDKRVIDEEDEDNDQS